MTGLIFQYPCRDGTSGLELDSVRHNYTRINPSYGCGLVIAVLQALDEAASCAPKEIHAATKIQATFRMYRQATAFRDVRQKACVIQRIYRGYSTRKRLEHERRTTLQLAYLQTVFDMFATRIQATFRGYRSRKTTSNYYAQQAYINKVTMRSLGVLRDAHRTRAEQDKMRSAEVQRLHALNYARRTARMHHTVSTCAIPSVYLRPPATSGRLALAAHTACGSAGGDTPPGVLAEALEDFELEQAAVYTAGERLEDDIREHSRLARLNRGDLSIKSDAHSGASTSFAERSAAQQAKKALSSPGSSSQPHVSCLPALDPTSRTAPTAKAAASARVGKSEEDEEAKRIRPVSWEDASATAPQRPLVSQTLKMSSAAATSRTAENAANGVSSFHRGFSVKRHDCMEHDLSCNAGVTQRAHSGGGAAAVTFPGPLSTAKERAALDRSVDHKLVKSVHGDAVFKVPAGRGKRVR